MIPIRIPAEDMKVLEAERYTHPHPRVQRQRHTLYLGRSWLPAPRRGAHNWRV